MNERALVIAPHPDDETLGCGGTILRLQNEGVAVFWLIVTQASEAAGFKPGVADLQAATIARVSDFYRFKDTISLGLPATQLDTLPLSDVVSKIGDVVKAIRPTEIYAPNPGDAHTDHGIVFQAAAACVKWFRYPSVKRFLTYETLSETDFGLNPGALPFHPNLFVNISSYLPRKLAALSLYPSEIGEFPFPRSQQSIRALAELRGTASGCAAAEAFSILRELR